MSVEGTGDEDQQITSGSTDNPNVPSDKVEPADPTAETCSDAVEACPSKSSPTPPPQRICLNAEQMQSISKEDLATKWAEQDKFIDSLLSKIDALDSEG